MSIISVAGCPLYQWQGAHYISGRASIILVRRLPLYQWEGVHYISDRVSIISVGECALYQWKAVHYISGGGGGCLLYQKEMLVRSFEKLAF